MKKRTKRMFRKTASLFLALCISGMMLIPDAQADPTIHVVYTNGITDDSHAADQDPFGDLVLEDTVLPEDGQTEYAALKIEFPDGEGGGNVTVATGDLTSETGAVVQSYEFGNEKYQGSGFRLWRCCIVSK